MHSAPSKLAKDHRLSAFAKLPSALHQRPKAITVFADSSMICHGVDCHCVMLVYQDMVVMIESCFRARSMKTALVKPFSVTEVSFSYSALHIPGLIHSQEQIRTEIECCY